jgi:hypothetical protein
MYRSIRTLVTVVLALGSAFLAPWFALVGLFVLTGRSASSDPRSDVNLGLLLLGMAVFIWLPSCAWYIWLNRGLPHLRFSLSNLLIGMTILAVLLGLMAWGIQ